MACDPNALARAASCFQCLDSKQLAMVQAHTLAIIANVSPTPETLVAAAAPFQALSEKELQMVIASLLCKINGG